MADSCSWVSDQEQEAMVPLTAKEMGYPTQKEKQKKAIIIPSQYN